MNFLEIMRDVLKSESLVVKEIIPRPPWLSAWRELAALTCGIAPEDPRFIRVMQAIDCCDHAYLANDWLAFQRAGLRVRQLVGEKAA